MSRKIGYFKTSKVDYVNEEDISPINNNNFTTKSESDDKHSDDKGDMDNYSIKSEHSIEENSDYHDLIERTSMNWSINTMVKHFVEDCLNFYPSYQKNSVWTLEQKQDYILTLLHKKIKIKPTLILDYDKAKLSTSSSRDHFIVLDGKQRLNTIIEFYSNQFSIPKGTGKVYYDGLTNDDKFFFLSLNINYTRISYKKEIKTVPMDIQFELFLEINDMNTRQSDAYLENIVAAGNKYVA